MPEHAAITWPDTTSQPPPAGNPWRAAAWLLGRHPQLARLAGRIPGLVTVDGSGEPDIDLDVLADIIGYQDGRNDAVRDGIEDLRSAYAVMSSGEQALLRMLAVFAWDKRVPLRVDDLRGRDDTMAAFVRDWCAAIQAH